MPSTNEHLAKAQGNKTFAYNLGVTTPTAIGWALTALFYSALHYVEAYNAKYGQHFSKHEDLSRDIGRNPVLQPIYGDYKDLLVFSWNARYRPVQYDAARLVEAKEYHAAVEQVVSGLLRISSPRP